MSGAGPELDGQILPGAGLVALASVPLEFEHVDLI